ncbi:MAG: LamG domain-containing protein, partial [Candidatus Korobacteraceae bacterium]
MAFDSSTNGRNALLSNGVGWVTGANGWAISAETGNPGYVTIPAINLSHTKAVTVTFWANRIYSPTGENVLLEATANYQESDTGFAFLPDDKICHGIRAALRGNEGTTANCYSQPSSGVWHHLAVVYDKSQTGGDAISFYVDGVPQSPNWSAAASSNTNNFGNDPIYLFFRAGSSQFSSGAVNNLRIYDSALTLAQIQQIYNGAGTGTPVPAGGNWQQGFDFRNTAGFVTDPPGDTYVLATTAYPTHGNNVTFGWLTTYRVQGRDRTSRQDPRLAGINFATNGLPATFYVDLPSPGTYNLSLAMGDAGYWECWVQCQVQFLDGSTVLATLTKGFINLNYFYDVKGNNWSAAAWPNSNLSQQVTLTGSRLTMVAGTNRNTGDYTPIAFLGV